jgi:hypothetical protein
MTRRLNFLERTEIVIPTSPATVEKKAAGVPDPGFPTKEAITTREKLLMVTVRLATLLVRCSAFPGRPTVRQECPKLLTASECLTFAIADALDEPGQFPAAIHIAPVDPNDVAVHSLAFPGSRRTQAQDTGSPVTDRIQIQ